MITFYNNGYSFRMYGKYLGSPALIDTVWGSNKNRRRIFVPYSDCSDPIGYLVRHQVSSGPFSTGYYIYSDDPENYLKITNQDIDQKLCYLDIIKDIDKLNTLIENEKLRDAIEELP